MSEPAGSKTVAPVPRGRAGKHSGAGHELGVFGGLAALSLDALSSVAYGPQAMIGVLIAAGAGALSDVVPLTLVITAMLGLLVVSYSQVIEAHPELIGRIETAVVESLNGFIQLPENFLCRPVLGSDAGPFGAIALAMTAEL